jgi:hypothetical protein
MSFQRARRISILVLLAIFAASFVLPKWFVVVGWVWIAAAGAYLWRRYPEDLWAATITNYKEPVGKRHLIPTAILGVLVLALLIDVIVR